MRRIKYRAQPTAAKLHSSDKVVRGFMGCVGNGKSVTCIQEMFRISKRQWPNSEGVRKSRWAIIRNTRAELMTTTLNTWKQWFPEEVSPVILHPIINTRMIQSIRNDGTVIDMEVYFIALDTDKDVKKLLSMELTGVFCNEARELPFSVIKAARERIGRYPSRADGYEDTTRPDGSVYKAPRDEEGNIKPCRRKSLLMDTNPPDTDHWWYQLAEDGYLKGEKNKPAARAETARIFDFFRGPPPLFKERGGSYTPNPAAENIENLDGGHQYYLDMIAGNTEDHINVQVLGNYGAIRVGKPVYTDYNDRLHLYDGVLMPIKDLEICLGWDFGLTPSCIIGQLTETGQARILVELIAEDMSVRAFARDIVKPYLQKHFSDYRVAFSLADPAGNNRGEGEGRSGISILNDTDVDPNDPDPRKLNMGFTTQPAPTNDIMKRLDAVNSFLLRLVDGGEPGLLLAKRCEKLRKGFQHGYCYKKIQVSGVEEKYRDVPDKNQYSHPHDGLQYLCLGFVGGYVTDAYNDDNMYYSDDQYTGTGYW